MTATLISRTSTIAGHDRSRRRGFARRWAAPLTAAAFLAASAVALPSATASTTSTDAHRIKPTIVLVHGAWANGSSWNGEVQRLQDSGYVVDVVPNPLRGVASDTAYVKDYLSTISGPVVLVGHSYGGFVITNAATGNPNVKALVYVDAFVPDEGESVAALTKGSGSILEPALTDPTSVFALRPFPGAPAGVGDAYVLPELFTSGFAGDVPRHEAELLAVTQLPLATSTFSEVSGVPAWKTIPSWSLIGTGDRVIPAAGQKAMARRAGAHVVTVDASHLSLISHPREVSDVILAAVHATDH